MQVNSTENLHERFASQSRVIPADLRHRTAVMCCGFEADPFAGAASLSQLSAIGAAVTASDYPGPCRGQHWFTRGYGPLVEKLSVETEFLHLDPEFLAEDVQLAAQGRSNVWAVVTLNRPRQAMAALRSLAWSSVNVKVLLTLSCAAGVLVHRCSSVESALSAVEDLPHTKVPAGPVENSVMLGGIVVNEIMLAGEEYDPSPSRTVGFHSLARPERITLGAEGLATLFDELSAGSAPAGSASLAGRSLAIVGAGALGNWITLILALSGVRRLVIFDGDHEVTESNVSRQILLAGSVGPHPKVDVLVRELKRLDPHGQYDGVFRFVHEPEDIGDLSGFDALIASPDNDLARILCDSAAAAGAIPLAVAGSSPHGATVIVRGSGGRPCLPCLGLNADSAPASCAQAAEDSVVCTNALAAGLLVAELRQTLTDPAGAPLCHLRFEARSGSGNRVQQGMTKVRCPHRAAAVTPGPAERSEP